MTKKYLFALLCVMAPLCGYAQDVGSLRMTIHAEKLRYQSGEDIPLYVGLENPTGITVMVPWGNERAVWESERFETGALQISSNPQQISLEPGDTVEKKVVLRNDLRQGEYSLRLQHTNMPYFSQPISSNAVKIIVAEAKPAGSSVEGLREENVEEMPRKTDDYGYEND